MDTQLLLQPAEVPAAVREILAEYIDIRRPHLDQIGTPVTAAVDVIRDFVLGGGKRVRPLYGWAGYVGAGGGTEDPQAVVKAVSALEFIQACALIHDDIIDSSDTRRGNPTIHRAVAANHRRRGDVGDADGYGRSVAILAGDLALTWADDLLFDAGLTVSAYSRAMVPWRAMRSEVIAGQLLDIGLEASGSEDQAEARSVNRYKTAAYTIERPLHLGAAIAGGGDELITAFRGYGTAIGIAYQLRDDQLGVFGDPSTTGKPAGDDLREGKRTELLASALQRLDSDNPSAAQLIRDNVGTTANPDMIAHMSAIIEESGACEDIERTITELTADGLACLDHAPIAPEVVELLRSMAYKATKRRA